MPLISQINQDIIEAMRQKKEPDLSTLRLLKSALNNALIAQDKDLSSEDVIAIIQKEIKQRNDSIEQYTKANRPELADKEKTESEILIKYLPPQLSDEELSQIIADTISQINPAGPQDFGKIMSAIMPKVKGRADGTRIANIVREKLPNV